MGLLSRSGPSGVVDAPGGRRLSGLFGGDGCYRSKVLRRLTALAHAPDVCETENTTRDTTHGGARWPASATVCRKRPPKSLRPGSIRLRHRLGKMRAGGPPVDLASGSVRRGAAVDSLDVEKPGRLATSAEHEASVLKRYIHGYLILGSMGHWSVQNAYLDCRRRPGRQGSPFLVRN